MRAAKLAVVPLWVMAAAFVLPSYSACSGDPANSALDYTLDSAAFGAWISQPFVFAGLFALLTTFALLRGGRVSLRTRRIGLAALAALAVMNLTASTIWSAQEGVDWLWLGASLVSVPLAAALIRRARGHEPWRIWQHELGAFALLAAGTGPTVFLAGDALGSGDHIAWGGWVYLGALAALLALAARVATLHSNSEISPTR